MQIRELPRGGQLSIHGNIVNVPNDVNSTVNCLPRPVNESQTISKKLKRHLSYKHHYQFQSVRPKKVLDAAKYLVDTSGLFKREGKEVQNAWLDNISLQSSAHEDWSEFVENSDTLSNNELHTQTDKVVLEDKTQDYQKHYITKGQRGMSRLLEKASEEAQSSNKDITNRVRHIGNKFLNVV